MRRLLSIILPVSVSLLAAACNRPASSPGGTQAGAPGGGGTAAAGGGAVRKVGLLVTGPVSDGGWNEIAWKGCQQIKDRLGAEINNQLVTRPEQFEASFRGYAAAGYDLVFGHGAEFSDAAQAVGPKYPKTRFVVTGGDASGGNVASIKLAMEEGTYLLGMMAGSLTKSNRLGQIGGTPLAPVKQAFAAFEKGARAANPRVKVTTTYIGNWNDANAGKVLALALIRQGADLLFQNADAAGHGVFQAVQENKSKGILTFGANSDQTALAPDVILASSVLDVPHAFLLVAESVRDGKFDGSPFVLGMKDQVVSVVYNPALKEKLPSDLQQKLEATRADIISGKLKLVGSGSVASKP
jgi:basic membrane protein A and related proteins